jgi:pimeloyl-ACP methyl ester carboxylesterase
LLAEEFTEHSAAGITASFRTTNYSLPLGDSLEEISMPVLFTNGVEEEGFQKHLPRVRLIPQVEIVDLPASHAVNAHDPRGWNRAAVDFIKRHTDIGV